MTVRTVQLFLAIDVFSVGGAEQADHQRMKLVESNVLPIPSVMSVLHWRC